MATVIRIIFTAYTVGVKVPAGLYIPNLATGATLGRAFGIFILYLHRTNPNFIFFWECPEDSCVEPGVYAVIGAVAVLGSVTKMTGGQIGID